MKEFRSRFGIPISDEQIANDPFYKPAEDSEEIQYLKKRRAELGGFLPSRKTDIRPIKTPPESLFEEFYKGTEGREVSTTMVFVRILAKLLKDKEIGKLVVPIVPDEARTFGMEALFRQVGIYSHAGQLYEPVDADSLLYYKEAKNGQILEEGITEAGSMSSFIAAGTAYLSHGINMIPFLFITQCLDCKELAILFGLPVILVQKDFYSVVLPEEQHLPAKGYSIRMVIVIYLLTRFQI